MRRKGLKPTPWARSARVSEGTLRAFLTGKSRSMQTDTLERLAKAADANVSEIIGARGNDAPIASRDVVRVRSYRIVASAGGGRVAERTHRGATHPEEERGPDFFFPKAFVEHVLRATGGELAVVWVKGDSMAPTLNDGDVVLVRTTDTDISVPGVFAIADHDFVSVKRLQITSVDPPRVKVISDNRLYEPYETAIDGGALHVIGRVMWRGGAIG